MLLLIYFLIFVAVINCPIGKYSSVVGASVSSTCLDCIPGSYCQNPATVTPVTCPAGYYCPAGTNVYTSFPCPAGSYSNFYGLFSASQCSTCPAGAYCSSGHTSYTNCASGTYNPYTGGTSASRYYFILSYFKTYMIKLYIYTVASFVKLGLRAHRQVYLHVLHLAHLAITVLLGVHQALEIHVLLELILIPQA